MLHGMWDLPGPGIEPVSPALAGRFLTTVPPEEYQLYTFLLNGGKEVALVTHEHPFNLFVKRKKMSQLT